MAEAKRQPPVKLFFGLFLSREDLLAEVLRRIELDFSPVDFQSATFQFTHTNYYREELGENILRKFIACQMLINQEEIADIKLYTTRLEQLFSDAQTRKRRVNIDPGYLSLSKVVLATTKDYDHRIYLKSGIYAEVTLHYRRRLQSYEPWQWTYPDYREQLSINFFNQLRQIYYEQLKLWRAQTTSGIQKKEY